MDYQTILYEKTDGVGVVTIDRPEVLNALNDRVFAELADVFRVMQDDKEIRCVVITGKGRAFIAGADVKAENLNTVQEEHAFLSAGQQLLNTIESFRTPVVAAVNGYALGGGLELAMACDIRIAAETAKMGVPEVTLASFPALGGTFRLPMLVGLARAKELIITGRHIKAPEAYSYGLVHQVVSSEELMDTVMEMARKIATRAPQALEYGKIAVTAGYWCDPKASAEIAVSLRSQLQASSDRKEAYDAFLEKRDPKPFTGC
ncbi:MAG: enoyl-CoA hydratase/isomerase family protein [Firmicutes bacterium]|nr:enoyl-CoA hydratase/isomerase family protein [Bacillota bacterium]